MANKKHTVAESATEKAAETPRMQGTSIDQDAVFDYLAKHYPSTHLGWVARCLWSKDNLLLSSVSWEERPGGIDKAKVNKMAAKIKDGDQPHPIVVVAPDASSSMFVVDGYHRAATFSRLGQESVSAWVGIPKPGNVGWKADIEQMQFTTLNHKGMNSPKPAPKKSTKSAPRKKSSGRS